MIKKLVKLFSLLIFVLIIFIAYLSIFGIKTNKFNDKIKNKVSEINKKINLDLKTVKILLDVKDLALEIKITKPIIIFENQKLPLEYVKTSISIKSFIKNELSINNLNISTKEIKLNNIISLARSFKNSTELFLLDKIIKDGYVVGNIYLNFDDYGKIKNNYEINGFIKNGNLSLFKKYNINNLNLSFKFKNKEYFLQDIKTNFNQIKISLPFIQIKESKNILLINGKLLNEEDDISIKFLNNFFENTPKDFNIEKINLKSKNDFSFELSKKLKINNFILKSEIDLKEFTYKNNLLDIKNYLPNFKDTIKLKENKILINYKKDKLDIYGKGKIVLEDKIEFLEYQLIRKNNNYNFDTTIDINKSSLLFKVLDYKKNKDSNSTLNLRGTYKHNKEIYFNSISFKENDNQFLFKNLYLDNKFKILDIDKIDLDYVNNNKIKNQISLKKNKNTYQINGKSFDFIKIIDEILHTDEKVSSSIFSNLTSYINIKINKAYLDQDEFVTDLSGYIQYKNNKINKLNLISTFPNNKKLSLTINTNKKNEKITTLFSDYPKPLVQKYKFIKGFEQGVLDFYSIKKDGRSNSLLTIDNFKIQEVPVFAKLLSLASLQGIADLLTGEGIRFTDFEMKFSNNNGQTTIEEMYAIGPAVSILMEGYIEAKKLVSLRGTLVPATTINRTIASIPLIGDILVGKKTGEGIFGVSFKIKGLPKNLKTSVNPIKTLTPRFITRTLENIKKN